MTPLVHYLYSLTLSRVEIHILRGRHPHLKPRYKWCYLLSSVYNLSGPLAAACHHQQWHHFKLSEQSWNQDCSAIEGDHILWFSDCTGIHVFQDAEVQTPFWKRSSRLHLPSPFLPPTVSNWLSEILPDWMT